MTTAPPVCRRRQHLVIGAGFAGLGVAAAFARAGIEFDVVEADDDVGGNWYRGVYDSVHLISSRKTTEYADFPMPPEWPDFPSGEQMLDYLRRYADHWRLRPRIEFHTRVVYVEPAANEPGLWTVSIEKTGERDDAVAVAVKETRIYGGVVVANGHHWDRRWPDYPGNFAGEFIHSKDYKTPAQLLGKRVLVIGGGNSACDIAVEASRAAAQSHISMRRGYWFMPKTAFGIPSVELLRPWMPESMQRQLVRALVVLAVGDYQRYGLEHPDHPPLTRHPTINSELLYHLRHGRITPHRDVDRFDGHTVHFVDGSQVDVDLTVCATGFHISFPFLAPGLVETSGRMPKLFGSAVPKHKNLYIFGVGQPRYGAGPLISAGADVLCTMVDIQRQLEQPLSSVLAALGAKPSQREVLDPFRILRQAKIAQRVLPRLPAIEPWLLRSPRSPRKHAQPRRRSRTV